MSDADTFLREHRPSFDYTRGGEYIAVCAGCTRAAGDYIEWPCAHIWGAADVLARRDDLLAEAWQEGRNSVARGPAAADRGRIQARDAQPVSPTGEAMSAVDEVKKRLMYAGLNAGQAIKAWEVFAPFVEFAERELAEAERRGAERGKADGWDEGHKVGWEHCQDGNYGTDYWDDDTRNPYRAGGDQ